MRLSDKLTVIGAFAVVFGPFAYLKLRPESPPAAAAPADPAPSAREMCRRFAEQRLHDPSRAEWVEQWNWTTAPTKDGAWAVHMRFRAPNRMGGQQLNTYLCTVREAGAGEWKLEQIVSTSP
jgi:hypothetical protein